jgi:hypothetical protein
VACEWDVQWEDLRVTIAAQAVHNDHVEGLTLKTQDKNPGDALGDVTPSDKLLAASGPPKWFLKLSTIVRAMTGAARTYTLYIVVFRSRKWW